ncbi:MAG TPA: ABC transporter ATP-binding protein [Bacteriovoracaceae bacterium]|nr:ABC transporter ATP-binding protein [Bacteriovoracaceae bacterium]
MLSVENLNIRFSTKRGVLQAVHEVSFSLEAGEVLGIVGESGCGKSITNLALMGLLPTTATVSATKMNFDGEELLDISEKRRRKLRGKKISMIFQDPMSALNPSFSVGQQIDASLKVHGIKGKSKRRAVALELLAKVGITDGAIRLKNYPHELSGGMCQRVMIALSLALRPKLLIADEPTTALDVTIQAQILKLLVDLQKDFNMGMIFVTHDLGVVASVADKIMVMYAGEVVEMGTAQQVLSSPAHPYTKALLASLPESYEDKAAGSRQALPTISGMVPDLINRASGCQLYPRCGQSEGSCETTKVGLVELADGRRVRCLSVGEKR